MKRVFLVSLDGTGVCGGHSIIGFLSDNDKEIIANYIKNQYGLTLQKQLPNKFTFQNDYHWEYTTDNHDVNVHVDVCYNLNEYDNE